MNTLSLTTGLLFMTQFTTLVNAYDSDICQDPSAFTGDQVYEFFSWNSTLDTTTFWAYSTDVTCDYFMLVMNYSLGSTDYCNTALYNFTSSSSSIRDVDEAEYLAMLYDQCCSDGLSICHVADIDAASSLMDTSTAMSMGLIAMTWLYNQ